MGITLFSTSTEDRTPKNITERPWVAYTPKNKMTKSKEQRDENRI